MFIFIQYHVNNDLNVSVFLTQDLEYDILI